MVRLGQALQKFDDGGAESFGFFGADAGDGSKLGDGARALKHDAAQRGGTENKELRQANAFGFGLAPGTQLLVEELLGGGERGGGIGCDGAGAMEGGGAFAGVCGAQGRMRGAFRFGAEAPSGERTAVCGGGVRGWSRGRLLFGA